MGRRGVKTKLGVTSMFVHAGLDLIALRCVAIRYCTTCFNYAMLTCPAIQPSLPCEHVYPEI